MTEKNANESEDHRDEDFQEYMEEMEGLSSDFSDLEDLDFEEIREMKEAIEQVKEFDEDVEVKIERELHISEEKLNSDVESEEEMEKKLREEYDIQHEKLDEPQPKEVEPINKDQSEDRIQEQIIEEELKEDLEEEIDGMEDLISDFSDLGRMDLDELLEMKSAINTVKEESSTIESNQSESEDIKSQDMTAELEKRLEEELSIAREEKKKDVMTEEKFLEYLKDKRDKIWYHALYFLTYKAEDNIATKEVLYEMLKEDTSKSAIDPIPEHQFFFGLGYLLRLTINEEQIVRYQTGGKFKLNVSPKKIKGFFEEAGEPISTKPEIPEEEKKKMFKDFLETDFSEL